MNYPFTQEEFACAELGKQGPVTSDRGPGEAGS